MKKLAALVVVFVASATSIASASHHSPLYQATDCYRDAVVDFERHVIKSRMFERYDVRLVDDLEDSTSRLRSASRHVHRSQEYDYRFASAMRDINKLQARVEQAIFGQACYHPSPELIRCWQSVVHAYTDVLNEARCVANREHSRGQIQGQEIFYRPPVYAPHELAPPVLAPPVIIAPPQQMVPQRHSVNYRPSYSNHHAAMQVRIGAMLQRR
jgi:hypothetical protein